MAIVYDNTMTENGGCTENGAITTLDDNGIQHTSDDDQPMPPVDATDDDNSSHSFGWHMIRSWILYAGLPTGLITWKLTGSFVFGGIAVIFLPASALLQGAIHIVRYRMFFGGTPVPHVPCSGIVKATSKDRTAISSASDACPTSCNLNSNVDIISGTSKRSVSFDGDTCEADQSGNSNSCSLGGAAPLRLLVIGDSLAIGVGQSKHATPVLPEAMAKTLSKALGGRPVAWTCYGAPGASAGWIAKELEHSYSSPSSPRNTKGGGLLEMPLKTESETETDDSSSSDCSTSFSDDEETNEDGDRNEKFQQLAWHKRLFKQPLSKIAPSQQGQRLTGGPYDIAVVFTGGNDVKSTFFPFLLTGEDARLHKQARLRGGVYSTELRRVLEMLNRRMRLRLQTLRESVEAARENLKEYIVRDGQHHQHPNDKQGLRVRTSVCNSNNIDDLRQCDGMIAFSSNYKSCQSPMIHDVEHAPLLLSQQKDDLQYGENSTMDGSQQLFPMVVLPGMPAPALPIFEWGPLRWFSLNIVQRMDSQKRNLARNHKGEVLFIEAPSVEDITDYQEQAGRYWQQKHSEETSMKVRGIKQRRARHIEAAMKRYIEHCKKSRFAKKSPSQPYYSTMFSLDGIHPTDEGYDFWGRYIANAIVREWKESGKEAVDPLD